MTTITIYRDREGVWRLAYSEESIAVDAELAVPYRVEPDEAGRLCIARPGDSTKMTAEEAVRVGVLQVPVVWPHR
jgi:hypothetical protein